MKTNIKHNTKRMFAEQLILMTQTTPIEKIRVQKIAEACGTLPPTFYYHFKDKYELIAWIFIQDFIALNYNHNVCLVHSAAKNKFHLLEEKKHFYQAAYNHSGQNALTSYVFSFCIKLFSDAYKHYYSTDTIPTDDMLQLTNAVYGFIGLIKDWNNETLKISLEELSNFFIATSQCNFRRLLITFQFPRIIGRIYNCIKKALTITISASTFPCFTAILLFFLRSIYLS